MKICPKCGSSYADDTLFFCLDDGTPLSGSNVETPTVVFQDADTVVRRPNNAYFGEPAQVSADSSGKRNVFLAVVLTAAGMLAIGGIAVVAALFYFNSPKSSARNSNIDGVPSPTPTVANSTPSVANALQTPTPTIASNTVANLASPPMANTNTTSGDPDAKNSVTRQLYAWRSAMVSRDLDSYMANYADTVDFYTKRGISRSTVRADKARAFAAYDSMIVNVSNVDVAVGSTSDTAIVTFDKEWTFSGRDTSRGKVRSRFEFRRINGRWLITSERDVRVYSVR